jgi:hypothetical protein
MEGSSWGIYSYFVENISCGSGCLVRTGRPEDENV